MAVIWARNTDTNTVNAFIVRCKSNPGYSCTKIENKIALRCVQNGDILLKDAFVPDADRLPGGWFCIGWWRGGQGWVGGCIAAGGSGWVYCQRVGVERMGGPAVGERGFREEKRRGAERYRGWGGKSEH